MPASIGVNLRVTGHCDQGGRKYMEDYFSVAYQQTMDEKDLEYAFFGIFDGHGGGEAAAFAKEHLMNSIVNHKSFWSDDDEDVLKAIRTGYMQTHQNMWKALDYWPKTISGLPSTAGTTASVAFIRRGKIYIGHVGDSAIVLGYQDAGHQSEWRSKALTKDHKPEFEAEQKRIELAGGKVMSKTGVSRVVWYRPRPGHQGPIKPDTPTDEIPFLSVARSLGDLWSYNWKNDDFMVSPDPDVGVLTIDPSKFRCLIFGTDGLWNMVTPKKAVSVVQATEKHNDAAAVADFNPNGQPGKIRRWINPSKTLVDHAIERWSHTRMRADNTSVVTLMLDPSGPPRAEVLCSRSAARALRCKTSVAHSTNHGNTDDDPGSSSLSATPNSQGDVEDAVSHDDGRQIEKEGSEKATSAIRLPRKRLTVPIDPRVGKVVDLSQLADKPSCETTETVMTDEPLPPCASLAVRSTDAIPTDETIVSGIALSEYEDDKKVPYTYGNPKLSQYIYRTLHNSHVKNCLEDVMEEIIISCARTSDTEEESPESVEQVVDLETNVCERPVPTAIVRRKIQNRLSVSSTSVVRERTPEVVESETEPRQINTTSTPIASGESIQLNEVSSTSPIDGPPINERTKSKTPERIVAQAHKTTPSRSLRSQDTANSEKAQSKTNNVRPKVSHLPKRNLVAPQMSKNSCANQVIILNRSKGILVTPSSINSKTASNKETVVNGPSLARVTRSKDTLASPADSLRKAAKDTTNNKLKKAHSPESDQVNFPLGKSKNEDHQPQATISNGRIANEIPTVESSCGHNDHAFQVIQKKQAKSLNSHLECSKENFVTDCPDDMPSGLESPISALDCKTPKRRISGNGITELEPKQKRCTRLNDKKILSDKQTRSNRNHVVSSTKALRTTSYLLGLHIGASGIHAPIPIMARRKFKSVQKGSKDLTTATSSTGDIDSTSDNISGGNFAQSNDSFNTSSSIPSRALRSKNDLNHSSNTNNEHISRQSGKTETKSKLVTTRIPPTDSIERVLRSKNGLKLVSDKECHFIPMDRILMSKVLKSKNFQPNVEIERIDKKREELLRQTRSAAPSKRVVFGVSMSKRLVRRGPWSPSVTAKDRLPRRFSK